MDLQEYRDELARKSLDKLSHVTSDFNNGKIGIAALRAAVNAIWWITSGLVAQDVMNVIDAASKEVEAEYQRRMSALK